MKVEFRLLKGDSSGEPWAWQSACVKISSKAIDRAGVRLRDWAASGRPEEEFLDEKFLECAEAVWEYRRELAPTLRKVTVGVRQFVQRGSTQVFVAQRLKRLPTIINKLERHPTMKLTRMQDIGGCRAILPGGTPEVSRVIARMLKNSKTWKIRTVDDYGAAPRSTGYRAVHVVVVRDGRMIEIQLRTLRQHAWATEVERVGFRNGHPHLKDGEGPADLLAYYELVGQILAIQDRAIPVDERLLARFRELRTHVDATYAMNG